MPSVEMRRSTRVFVPKAKDGGDLGRVLRSGRRLFLDVNNNNNNHNTTTNNNKGGGGGGGGGGVVVRNGDDWFPLLNDDGTDKLKMNGWHGLSHPVHDLPVLDRMDVDEAKPQVLELNHRLPLCSRDHSKVFVNVYSRKRKRNLREVVDQSNKFGLHFVRRKKSKFDLNDGVLMVIVEPFCLGCSFFSSLLTCLLKYVSETRVGLAELSGFLVSNPISQVFASFGVHFLWNPRAIRNKGVCKVVGVRQMVAMLTVDYMAVPQCFQHIYYGLLIRSVRISCLRLIEFGKKIENDVTDEPLAYINDQNVSSKRDESPRNVNKKIESTSGVVLALAVVNAKDVKPAHIPTATATATGQAKSSIRNVPARVGVLTRSSSKRRRRSLRNRKARNPLHLVFQKLYVPPVSTHQKSPVSNAVSHKKTGSSLPLGPRQDLSRSVRKTTVNEIQVPNSRPSGLNVDIDSQSCFANILVVDTDKCYRVEGAEVMLEPSASNDWHLVVKKDGLTRYSFKVQREMRPCGTNRFTHDFIWSTENGWKLEFPDRKQHAVFKELHKVCEEKNIVPLSPVKIIPIPEVCEVTNQLDSPGAFKRPESYIRTTSDELSRTLSRRTANYDMDSDDEEWLSNFNSELDASNHVSDVSFELMIDAFEKASFCNPEDVIDEKEAATLCFDVGSLETAEPVYTYWMKKRKQKGGPLIRVFQLNHPTRSPMISKPVLRKKRSLKRPAVKSIQRGRGKDSSVLRVAIAGEQYAEEEQSAMRKVEEAKASAEKSVEVAILKRQRAQFLMENADLAMYQATMALRIADVAAHVLDSHQAANHFLN